MELARRAGVSPSYVSLIEHGEKVPSENVAVRLAQALDEREDLYRVWAVASRMDERTREAMMRVSQSGKLDDVSAQHGAADSSSAGGSSQTPALERGLDASALEDSVIAHGITMPLLTPGACPADGEITKADVEDFVAIDRRALGYESHAELLAVRIDELNGARVRSWLRVDDLAVVEREPGQLHAGRVHLVRTPRHELVLSKVALSDGTLLLLADPSDEAPPRKLTLEGESTMRETLVGSVVASIRRWR